MLESVKRCKDCGTELISKYAKLCSKCEDDYRRRNATMIFLANGYMSKKIPTGYSDNPQDLWIESDDNKHT